MSDDIELNISVDSNEADQLIGKLDKINSQMRELKQNSSISFSALDFLNAKLDAYEGVVGRIRAQRQDAGMGERPGVPPGGGGPAGPPPPPRSSGFLFEAEERRRRWSEDARYGIVPYIVRRGNYEGGIPINDGRSYSGESGWYGGAYYRGRRSGTASMGSAGGGTFAGGNINGEGFIFGEGKVNWEWGRRSGGADWTWGGGGPPGNEPPGNDGVIYGGESWRPGRRWGGGFEDVEHYRSGLMIADKRRPEAEEVWSDPRKNWAPNPEPKSLDIEVSQIAWALSKLTEVIDLTADTLKGSLGIRLAAGTKAFSTLGNINFLDPFSILKAKERLGGIAGDVQVGYGGLIKNAGAGINDLMSGFGPIPKIIGSLIKGGSSIGGTMLEMSGMKTQATASIRESAVGMIGNLASAITTVLGGAVKLAEGGIRLFANTVRSAVGSITQLLGVSAALGTAGAYAATRLVGNEYKSSVDDPMRPFTGISLKQQNIWKQMEQTYGLSENAIYASQLESQRRASSFRTQGQFNNQLPSALAGMIGYMTLDSSFDERVSYLQNAVSKLQNFPSMRNNLENWVNQMGLNTEMQVASMRYEYGLDNSYYAHPRIDEIQRGRIVNGGIYRQLQGVSDAVNDEMANAIYSRGIAGGPSGEQWQKQWIEFKNSLSRSLETGDVMGPLMAGANLFHMAGKQVQTTWDAVTKRFPAINKVGHELVGGVSGALQWGGGLLSIISRIGSARDADDPSKGRVSIGDAFDYIATGIKDVKDRVIKPLVSDITGAFSELGPKITGAIAGGINFLTKPGGIMEGMVNFIANFGENVRGLLDKLFDGVDMNRAVVVGKALMYNVISVFAQGFDAFAEIVDKGVSGLISNTLSRLQWALVPQGIFGEQNDPRTGKKFEGLTMDQGNAWKEVTSSYRKSIAIDWTEFNLETGAGYGKRLGNEEFGKKVFDKGKWSKDGFMPMELIKEYGEHVDEMYRLMEENGYLGTEIDDMIGTVLYSAYTNKGGAGRLPNYMRKSRKEITDNIYAFLTTPQLFSPMSILDSFRGKDKFFDEVIMGSFGAFYDKDKKMFSFENAVEALTPAVESMGEGEAKNLALRVLEEFNRIVEMLGEIFKEGFKIENEVTMKTDEGNQIEIDNSFVTNILGARGRRMVLH